MKRLRITNSIFGYTILRVFIACTPINTFSYNPQICHSPPMPHAQPVPRHKAAPSARPSRIRAKRKLFAHARLRMHFFNLSSLQLPRSSPFCEAKWGGGLPKAGRRVSTLAPFPLRQRCALPPPHLCPSAKMERTC